MFHEQDGHRVNEVQTAEAHWPPDKLLIRQDRLGVMDICVDAASATMGTHLCGSM